MVVVAVLEIDISIHALREEGDNQWIYLQRFRLYFYPRPPRGGRLLDCHVHSGDFKISIHALREEGDLRAQSGRPWTRRFLSTPSARRATEALKHPGVHGIISIHALREEGDHSPSLTSSALTYFYPRPPRGGRHGKCAVFLRCGRISIHALREEGDGS